MRLFLQILRTVEAVKPHFESIQVVVPLVLWHWECKIRKFLIKIPENIWRFKKCPYLCSPFEKMEFIEKTEKKTSNESWRVYKKQVPRTK